MSETSTQQDTLNLEWSIQLDTLLANWCDQAKCFEWMHNEAYNKYYTRSQHFIITMTIVSALAGTTSINIWLPDLMVFWRSCGFIISWKCLTG